MLLTTSTARTDVTTLIPKTAQAPFPASTVTLPPPPTSNAVLKPIKRQISEFDAGEKEVLGNQHKSNKNITNYRTIVSSIGVALVRINAPTASPRYSNAWNITGEDEKAPIISSPAKSMDGDVKLILPAALTPIKGKVKSHLLTSIEQQAGQRIHPLFFHAS